MISFSAQFTSVRQRIIDFLCQQLDSWPDSFQIFVLQKLGYICCWNFSTVVYVE